MERLPPEVLNQIFLLFDQKQKIELMRVCQKWARTIRAYSLFHTVRILTKSGLNRLVKKVQNDPGQGAKVERLFFDFLISNEFDISLVPTLFPNLRIFYVFGCDKLQQLKEMILYPWYRHVEFIMEHDATPKLTGHLLSSNMCSYLRVLSVHGGFSNSKRIISLLPTAPTLEKLKMTEFNFTIDDLELLHTYLPSLHTLLLYNGQLYNSRFPSKIHPATSTKVFRMHFLDVFEIATQAKFIQYINKKYTSLQELSIHAVCYDIEEENPDMIYKEGWVPLFRTLGSQLTTLTIDPRCIPDNIFEILDNSGCQIQNLYLHSYSLYTTAARFKKSRQAKFIESIVLEDQGGDPLHLESLKELPVLNKLKLVCPRTIKKLVKLNHILESCPDTLESISFEYGELQYGTITCPHFSIRSLSLYRVAIPESMDYFIRQHLPKLDTLSINDCQFYGRRLDLSTLNLRFFEILDYFPPNNNGILVKTRKDNKQRWYIARHKMKAFDEHKELLDIHSCQIYPVIKSIPFEEYMTSSFTTTLICSSIRDLIVIIKGLKDRMEEYRDDDITNNVDAIGIETNHNKSRNKI